MFAGRLAARRSEKAQLEKTIGELEQQIVRGAKRITPEVVERYGVTIAEKLRDKDPILRKAYVRLLVDRIVVTPESNRIIGSKAALESAVLDRKISAGRVPSLAREWCPGKDSNLHIVANTST